MFTWCEVRFRVMCDKFYVECVGGVVQPDSWWMWELMDLQWFPVGWRWTGTSTGHLTSHHQYQPVSPQWNLEWESQQLLFFSGLSTPHYVWEYNNNHLPLNVLIFPDFLTLKNWGWIWRKGRDTSTSPVTQLDSRNQESVNISLTFLTSFSSFSNSFLRFVRSYSLLINWYF